MAARASMSPTVGGERTWSSGGPESVDGIRVGWLSSCGGADQARPLRRSVHVVYPARRGGRRRRTRAGRARQMISVGSLSRERIAESSPFLAPKFRGRRNAIKELTHVRPDSSFGSIPMAVFTTPETHTPATCRGHEHLVDDKPDYGGFLRGRIVASRGRQLVVVYCRPAALAVPGPALTQFLRGIDGVPVPLAGDTIVISDNADLYDTLADLAERQGDPG